MSRRAKPTPGTLGDVDPGDWATLEDGREVMVSWHTGGGTTICVDGVRSLESKQVVVTSVRKRERDTVQGGEVDPLRMES